MLKYLKEINLGITHIVSGGAPGADSLAERLAKEFRISITIHYANWDKFGKSAGAIRNEKVVNDCEAVVAFPGPDSIGTRDVINKARLKGIPMYVKEANQ
jgi:hypothetical protein